MAYRRTYRRSSSRRTTRRSSSYRPRRPASSYRRRTTRRSPQRRQRVEIVLRQESTPSVAPGSLIERAQYAQQQPLVFKDRQGRSVF